ncbi:hypothetical protein CPC08DRAFT_708202 [Agrocybe pediades]|nr:hypothetical protein CPC08DRAFT_708202 [Agrocybe pediades]
MLGDNVQSISGPSARDRGILYVLVIPAAPLPQGVFLLLSTGRRCSQLLNSLTRVHMCCQIVAVRIDYW